MNHIDPKKLTINILSKDFNSYDNLKLDNSYPTHPPIKLTINVNIFRRNGKIIITGVGKRIHLNILPPTTAKNINGNIPRNIIHPSSLNE